MSSRMTIAVAVVFLLVGIAGFVYILARPRPPIVAEQPDVLPVVAMPTPTPESTPREVAPEKNQSPPASATSSDIPNLSVQLLSPAMAETFIAPANVTLKAQARPARQLTGIEFYYMPVGIRGNSFCRSLSEPNATLNTLLGASDPAWIKIGETAAASQSLTWNLADAGTFAVIAVATYRSHLKQISPPVVIVTNPVEDYDGPKWKGWRPFYPVDQIAELDARLMPSPTPTPACPTITVNSLNPAPPVGSLVTFAASVVDGDYQRPLKYRWSASGGTIVGGQSTSTVTVSTAGFLTDAVTVTVETGEFSQTCPNTASLSVPMSGPRWLKSAKSFLRAHVSELERLAEEVSSRPAARSYLLVYGPRDSCLERETIEQARILKQYLVEVKNLDSSRISLLHAVSDEGGIEDEGLDWLPIVVGPREDTPDIVQKARPMETCSASLNLPQESIDRTKVPFNRKCPDLIENIQFTTSVSSPNFINICPYNSSDPQNDDAVINIRSGRPAGRFGNFPNFQYWTNGGKILGEGLASIWDLSEVKLRPGIYTAIAEADDGCDCVSLAATQVALTNFCTPCLTGARVCAQNAPENGRQVFSAKSRDFATTFPPRFRWETSKGNLVDGQGTQTVTIDTSQLAAGTKFLVTVSVEGLQRYCVNKLSYEAVAGEPCVIDVVKKFDEYGSAVTEGNVARRRKPAPTEKIKDDEFAAELLAEQPQHPPNEKESIKVAWSPKVKTDDSFSIVVNYNRSQESVRISNEEGEITEELKLSPGFRLLKERYGPGYRVLANVIFESAGIDTSSCREQYQSLDNDNLEWTCNVTPKRAGSQTFNVALWVKGEARTASNLPPKEAEKVWSKNNLKVEVSSPIVTKTTVFGAASLCVVVGLGFSLRWLKIYRIGDTYNVGQAVAVGRNVHVENATVTQNAPGTSGQEEKNNG